MNERQQKFPTIALLAWYDRVKRELPWRETRDPYAILVSEIMLQQTQIATVIPFYRRFMARFPTYRDLAAADDAEVAAYWKGLGYYRRLHHLVQAARALAERSNENFPHSAIAWQELPGVGPYTAAAVASIAFDEVVPVLDTNVLRVATRFWALAQPPTQTAVRRDIEARLNQAIDPSRPGDFNQALMELGERLCLGRAVSCEECPLHEECLATREEDPLRYPTKKALAEPREFLYRVHLVFYQGALNVEVRTQRMLAGQWQFPMREIPLQRDIPLSLIAEASEDYSIRATSRLVSSVLSDEAPSEDETPLIEAHLCEHQPAWTLGYRYSHRQWWLQPRIWMIEECEATLLWIAPEELLRREAPLITAHQRVLARLQEEGFCR